MNKRVILFSTVTMLFFALIYIWYCEAVMVEVPHLSWFSQVLMADQFFSGELEFFDLFDSGGEHGMLANNIIYLVNLLLFHGMTKFDVVLNDINVIITGCIIVCCVVKTLEGTWEKCAGILLVSFFMFTCMQGSAGAMETQVRLGLLFFVITSLFIDKELHITECVKRRHLVWTLLLIFLSINVFGTMYSFAAIPTVWIIIVCCIWKYKRLFKNQMAVAGAYFAAILIYIFEYNVLRPSKAKENIFAYAIQFFLHPIQTLKCFCSWCANGILGYGYYTSTEYNERVWLTVGGLCFLIIVLAVVVFFITKMYLKTWMPLLLITYCFGVMMLVFLGRNGTWEWLASEWYNVHLKLLYAGTVWIYVYAWEQAEKFRIVYIICTTFLCICSLTGLKFCLERAVHMHSWYKNMQTYLFVDNPDDMPVDENGNTPLLENKDITMESIRILKKYHLSVYRYWDAYENCPSVVSDRNSIKYISGIYDDGWAEKDCIFAMRKEQADAIKFTCYAQQEQYLTVTVNGEVLPEKFLLKKEQSEIIILCDVWDDVIKIEISSDYAKQLSAPDERVCSYIITNIERYQKSMEL